MARTWSTLGKQLGNIAKEQGPKFIRARGPKLVEQLQKNGVLPKVLGTIGVPPRPPVIPGRPVASTSFPTAHRARRVVYAPKLDGRADPGEIVWTWVTFEDDVTKGKDRPVLVVGRDGQTLLGLMLSSNQARGADPDWIGIGAGSWDSEGRPSWVRLDRVLDVPEQGIRREGAILDRKVFDTIAARLCNDFSWR